MQTFAVPPQALQYWRRAARSRWLIPGLNLLLVLWLAWQLARLSWAFISGEEDTAAVDTGGVPVTAVKRDQQRHNERQIADWHLFGTAPISQPVKEEAPVDAPDTSLKLTLSGVFASADDKEARAIIGDQRGKEDSYALGDSLPGGVKLSAIHADRVILLRSGKYETLRLPRDIGSGVAPKTVSHRRARSVSGSAPAVDRNAALQRYRNEVRKNPSSFMDYVRATPARENGQFIGFRLQAGRKAGALADMGLQPGDVVTSINGVEIDNPAKGMEAMRTLAEGQSVDVTLLRGGEQVSMNFSLPASE